MSYTCVVTSQIKFSGRPALVGTKSLEYGGNPSISETIAQSASGQRVALAIDQSQLKMLYMKATGSDLTIKTNSEGTPTQTITLVDGVPQLWFDGNGQDCPITADITTDIYVTEGGTADSLLEIEPLVDPTI